MAPIRGNNLTTEQTADANLWLHKKEKMITDGRDVQFGTNDEDKVYTMVNGMTNALHIKKTKDGRWHYRDGDFGLGSKNNRFLLPDGFTVSMLIKAEDLTRGDSQLFDMRMANGQSNWRIKHFLRFQLGGDNGAVAAGVINGAIPGGDKGSQYLVVLAGGNASGGAYSGNKFKMFDSVGDIPSGEFLLTVSWHFLKMRANSNYNTDETRGWVSVFINGVYKDGKAFHPKNSTNASFIARPFYSGWTRGEGLVAAAIPATIASSNKSNAAHTLKNGDYTTGHGIRVLKGYIKDFRFYGIPFNDTQVGTLPVPAPANTKPTASGSNMTTTENAELSFTADNFGYVDADSDALSKVKIIGTVAGLKFNGSAVNDEQEIQSGQISKLKFTSSQAGDAVFTYQVHDGKEFSSTATMTIKTTVVSAAIEAEIAALNTPDNYDLRSKLSGSDIRKRRQRHTILRKIFSQFSAKKSFMATRAELGLAANISRTKIKVFKTGGTIDIAGDSDIGSAKDTGWYAEISSKNDEIKVKTRDGETINVKVEKAATDTTVAEYVIGNGGTPTNKNQASSDKWQDGDSATFRGETIYFGGVQGGGDDGGGGGGGGGGDGGSVNTSVPRRSIAKADVAELTAGLDSSIKTEDEHHLIVVSTNKVLSTTQFKQMFYSRGDDFFQIANVYECPDSCNSIHSSVWGIDCDDPHGGNGGNAAGLVSMGHTRLGTNVADGAGVGDDYKCYNFNKLGGRENDPKGCAWAYSYVHDQSRNFYAQHEVMGYLEKDTCVKRDFWTACSRMSIEDQLYGLAFASETDQDLCMAVTCARRWSEVEDALAESCAAANISIDGIGKPGNYIFTLTNIQMGNRTAQGGNPVSPFMYTGSSDADRRNLTIQSRRNGAIVDREVLKFKPDLDRTGAEAVSNMESAAAAISEYRATGRTGIGLWSISSAGGYDKATMTPINAGHEFSLASGYMLVSASFADDGADGDDLILDSLVLSADRSIVGDGLGRCFVTMDQDSAADATFPYGTAVRIDGVPFVDLYINVRVTNGHPQALDTILRVRFTVVYTGHEPSALHTWNTRASTAASGVIQSGVVGDAPEGGKEQHEDTTVVIA